jgi:hypothetical protein
LTDGAIGVGTKNAVSRFDDLTFSELTDPNAPEPAVLPLVEDFDDGQADHFLLRSGAAIVDQGRYHVTPSPGGDGISTVLLAEPLPADFEAEVVFNADPAAPGRATNSFFIFDYQSPTNFKFAGAYVGIDEWLIGHRDAFGWVTDSFASAPIDTNTDYTMLVEVSQGGLVKLYAGGVLQVSRQYADDPTDGATGIGTKNAIARFDNYSLRETGNLQTAGPGVVEAPQSAGGAPFDKSGFGELPSKSAKLAAAGDSLQSAPPLAMPQNSDRHKREAGTERPSAREAKERVFDEIAGFGGSFDSMFPKVNRLTASPLA